LFDGVFPSEFIGTAMTATQDQKHRRDIMKWQAGGLGNAGKQPERRVWSKAEKLTNSKNQVHARPFQSVLIESKNVENSIEMPRAN
jgi:D-mannonate dehydratase